MAAAKRKYTIVAQKELDHENPIVNGSKSDDQGNPGAIKKSKGKTRTKTDFSTGLPSRWPGDVSNTCQRTTSKQKPKINLNVVFDQLPDEIVLTILTYLNKASIVTFGQTCQRYQAVAYHPTLWRRVDMSYKRVDTEQLSSLLRRGTITLKMYQTTVEDSNLTAIDASTLRHLDLTSAIISTELLYNLLKSCRSLRKLSLESLPLNEKIIGKLALNEQVDTLNVAMCTGITFECCQLLMIKLPVLRCLNIAWTELSFESVQHLCEALPRCTEQLNISGQRYNLTDTHIQTLSRRAYRLRALDISDSVLISDQSIVALRQYSRLLTHLSASRCYLLTSTALNTLKALPAFSTLDVFGTLPATPLQELRDDFGTRIHLNMCPFSHIARPTTGTQRTSIWGMRTRL